MNRVKESVLFSLALILIVAGTPVVGNPKPKLQHHLEIDESIRLVSDSTDESVVSTMGREDTVATESETEPTVAATATTTPPPPPTTTTTATTVATSTTSITTTTTNTPITTSTNTTTMPTTTSRATTTTAGASTSTSTRAPTTATSNSVSVFSSKLILPIFVPVLFWMF